MKLSKEAETLRDAFEAEQKAALATRMELPNGMSIWLVWYHDREAFGLRGTMGEPSVYLRLKPDDLRSLHGFLNQHFPPENA